jgi:hypothetical protein
MRKFLISLLVALALALVAGPAGAQQQKCDAPRPSDFGTATQEGFHGSWEIRLYGGPPVCAVVVFRKDGTLYYAAGSLDGKVRQGTGEPVTFGKDQVSIQGNELTFNPSRESTLTLQKTPRSDQLTGHLRAPTRAEPYFVVAYRVRPQVSTLPGK